MFDEVNRTQYLGKVLEISGDLLVQHLGRGELFRHNLSKFEISSLPVVGDDVEIKYKDGIGQITLRTSSVFRESPELELKGTSSKER
jgi:hypothetical protein